MCRPSSVADDWVNKGCHIHVNGIELAIRPTYSPHYRDGFVFKKVFPSTPDQMFQAAARKARDECLSDPIERGRWRQALERSMKHVRSFIGQSATLKDLANGRQYEFLRLIRHLDAYEERYGNS